jgi:asparagine synthase (glutamine-hydrolysing)
LTINLESHQNEAAPEKYWALEPFRNNVANGFEERDEAEALEQLETLLKESVRLRMIADVPLGSFLSGGIDSSIVVALMQAQSSRAVKTYTIGFQEQQYNEAPYAKAIAEYLGTDHTELYVSPKETMAVIPTLPEIYDEPFADSSQIPTYLVSRLAREQVTVSLSGDGGDELFLGYNRYRWAEKIWGSVGWLPRPSRSWLTHLIQSVPVSRWDSLYKATTQFLPERLHITQIGDKMQKIATLMANETPEAVYDQLVTIWQNPKELIVSNSYKQFSQFPINSFEHKQTLGEWMSWQDIHTYLPDDILVKLDRASMAVSLEARVPLLDDHRVVEFATQLPYSMKYRNGKSKWLLRKLLYKYIPANLVERPKMGFGVPIGQWLRGPLQKWAQELLDPVQMKKEGILNSDPIQQKWREHLDGSRNWQYHLWNILMFQAWLNSN